MEDHAIVELYWARTESAISETAKKYGRYCKVIAHNILSTEEDSEECLNDTWLGAWNAMPDQRPSRLRAFLGRITRNLALDRLDYKNAAKRNNTMSLILSELEECISSPDDVEDAFDAGETAAAISAFLRTLEPDHRNVFLRRYWYADSIREVAMRFGMSESKVKSMLHRIRGQLKSCLLKEGISL